jgi:hypothetical protein
MPAVSLCGAGHQLSTHRGPRTAGTIERRGLRNAHRLAAAPRRPFGILHGRAAGACERRRGCRLCGRSRLVHDAGQARLLRTTRERITYLKVSCSIAGYQPSAEEIEEASSDSAGHRGLAEPVNRPRLVPTCSSRSSLARSNRRATRRAPGSRGRSRYTALKMITAGERRLRERISLRLVGLNPGSAGGVGDGHRAHCTAVPPGPRGVDWGLAINHRRPAVEGRRHP